MLAYVAFCHEQDVDWICVEFKEPFFSDRRHMGKVIRLSDKLVHECYREIDYLLVCHERWIRSIVACLESDVRLASLYDDVAPTGE